jgi:hypothetical protein
MHFDQGNESTTQLHNMLQKVIGSSHNGPKQLIFAIALANTKHRQGRHPEKVIPEKKQSLQPENKSISLSSHSRKLLESLALIKILGSQLVGFLSRSEASIPTMRLQSRMAEACDSVCNIMRSTMQVEESRIFMESIDFFEILWDTLHIGADVCESVDRNYAPTCRPLISQIQRYRSDTVYILSQHILNSPVPIFGAFGIRSEQRALEYNELQNERCKVITRVAGLDKYSCEACISSACKSLKEASA